MSTYTIKIDMKDVAEGDATDLAQRILDEHGEEYEADRGQFVVSISRDGFGIDWQPMEPA